LSLKFVAELTFLARVSDRAWFSNSFRAQTVLEAPEVAH